MRNTDILFLQEVHSTVKTAELFKLEWGGPMFFSHGEQNSRGVAIAIKKDLSTKMEVKFKDNQGRALMVQIELSGQSFLLVNIYAPNKDDPEFFQTVFEEISKIDNIDYTIVGGDFNIYLDSKLDRKGGKPTTTASTTWLKEFTSDHDWVDVWCYGHENVYQYTWKRVRPFIGTRFDYFFVPVGLVGAVHSCEITANGISDHLSVELETELDPVIRGKGFWKLNMELLREIDYVKGVNDIIDHFIKGDTEKDPNVCYDEVEEFSQMEPDMKWEILKMKIISFSQYYTKEKASKRQRHIAELKRSLTKLEKRLAMVNLSSQLAIKFIEKYNVKIDIIKKKLNEELELIARGVILRSKIRWYQLGEHNTRYFLNLEKIRAKNRTMIATKDHKGNLVTDSKGILQVQVAFYKQLYASNPEVKFEQPEVDRPKLSDSQRIELDKDITVEEIGLAISKMARERSPGADGLNANFYKVFFVRLKFILLDLYNYCFKIRRLHISARTGIITLLPKKSDLLLLKNWRPITLLCCDYKLISKVISDRIKSVLTSLIHENQTGFVPGRHISTNIRKAHDILDYVSKKNIAAVLILVDF